MDVSHYIHLQINIIATYICPDSVFRYMAEALVQKIVGVSIGLFVAAIMLPVAIVTLANVSWYSTNTAVKTMVTILLPVLAVIGIALYFLHND